MRIISDFKDYYDSVQRYGQDQTLMYIRETKKEKMNKSVFPELKTYLIRDDAVSFVYYKMRVIGFCGNLYPCFEMHKDYSSDPTYHYDRDAVLAMFSDVKSKHSYGVKSTQKALKEFFDKIDQYNQTNKWKTLPNPDCPIYVNYMDNMNDPRSKWILESNPFLKKYEFFRLFDVNTTYQKLNMFLSNVASPEKTIPDVSNADMISAKGFDKFSFRKDKE